jgi:hypothetical protein
MAAYRDWTASLTYAQLSLGFPLLSIVTVVAVLNWLVIN